MSKKFSVTFILFFVMNSIFGQGFRFGVLFDPTITWLRSDVNDVTRDGARLGFDLGMLADYYFAQNYAFATGISLFNTGGTLQYAQGIDIRTKDEKVTIDPGGKVKYKLQYVKIPVAMKFKTHMIGRFIYFANLGFDPMVRVTARADVNGMDNITVNKEVKLFNMGWHFGAGTLYSLGQDVSLMFGLSFMSTFIDITTPAHDMITSNNLLFRIGVVF